MASSSSSSTSAPVFFSRSSTYHVFLSFRGEDTRNNFVGHLSSALEHKGIQTYKDNKTLRQGETIGPALMKGIDESQIALVVFSDNYADSSWCLNELVYIMNHKETRGQIVIPVFYKVDPSEVRKQKGKFGEALTKAKHELKDTTKLESWRKALEDAGSICGFHYEDLATRLVGRNSRRIFHFSFQDDVTSYVGAELVPKGYKVQTPDGLAFCDKEREEINTFMVKHDSKSCIKILWKPYHYTKKVVLKVDANYKQKRKALKNVSSLSGIESLAMDMKNNTLTVIGDVDPVAIVTKLRKYCRTELLSVGPAEEYISGRR